MNARENRPTRLFVVGVGRSGTSLLQSMLGSHPEVYFLPESGFLRRYGLAGRSADLPLDGESRRTLARAWREDARLARVDGLQTAIADTLGPPSDLAATSPHRSPDGSPRALSLALYERLASGRTGRYVGDKDPRLIEHIETLAALWPDCRVVHIHRDPRDVLASKKGARWSAGQGVFRQILAAAVQFDLAIRAERRLPAEVLYTLSYEDLLVNPEDVLKCLCDWLDVIYTDDMLDFTSTARRLVAPDETDWKAQTLGPLLSHNSGRWTERLSTFEAAVVEIACRPALESGGHERSMTGPFVQRAAGALVGRLLRGAVALYVVSRRPLEVESLAPDNGSQPGPKIRTLR